MKVFAKVVTREYPPGLSSSIRSEVLCIIVYEPNLRVHAKTHAYVCKLMSHFITHARYPFKSIILMSNLETKYYQELWEKRMK